MHSFGVVNVFVWALALCVMGCPSTRTGQSGPQGRPSTKLPKQPKLVVGIVVDQMRYDYLARFWSNFGEGGFKRLVGEGSSFSNCNYNYVPTETAPGHASIFTGTTPSRHGIIMNDWIDQSAIGVGTVVTQHSSVLDSRFPYLGIAATRSVGRGASPFQLDATTIADQLKAATQGQAKTIGVSLKDRSAILPVGKSADAAFWFDDVTGNMISSTYYPAMKTGFPTWVDSVNALAQPKRFLSDPSGWTLLLPAAQYLASDNPDDSRYEGTYISDEPATFPHLFKIDPLNCCGEFKSTAWGNLFLKDFAKQVVSHYALGADDVTDFLSLSFSSTDMVAHQFGPQSREVEDTYLRLDRDLADFLTFLDARIGKANLLVFLTADHGGAPNPTYAQDHGEQGGWIEGLQLRDKLRLQLGDQAGKDSLCTAVKGHSIYLNRRLAAKRNLNLDSLRNIVVTAMQGFPGIEKAYSATDLPTMKPTNAGETLLQNGYYAERSGDVLYLANYGYMQAPYNKNEPWRYKKGTSHGTHYDYDTHVPLLWWGWSTPVMQSDVVVVIPDIAPTVCTLLKIAPTNKCSGKSKL